MDVNTNTRHRDTNETEDDEVHLIQRKRKITAQPQARYAPKKLSNQVLTTILLSFDFFFPW